MKRLILAGLVCATAIAAAVTTPKAQANVDCSVVLCAPCPDGYTLSPTPGNCCRCVRL